MSIKVQSVVKYLISLGGRVFNPGITYELSDEFYNTHKDVLDNLIKNGALKRIDIPDIPSTSSEGNVASSDESSESKEEPKVEIETQVEEKSIPQIEVNAEVVDEVANLSVEEDSSKRRGRRKKGV
jgi:hypothetical protein